MRGIVRITVAILAVAAACLPAQRNSRCGDDGERSPLYGHWIFYQGAKERKLEEILFRKNGTAVINNYNAAWEYDTICSDGAAHLNVIFPDYTISADYMLSGRELIFVYDDGDSAIFVKKGHLKKLQREKDIAFKRYQRTMEKERNEARKKMYFTDSRNGRKYKTVAIGGKTWMAENLNYKTDSSWCYNCMKYGRLYAWNTAKTACPAGWKLPDTVDWNSLVTAVDDDGDMLKSKSGWRRNKRRDESGNGTDNYGFSALPGGFRFPTPRGSNGTVGYFGFWWTTTEGSYGLVYYRVMSFDTYSVGESDDDKTFGFSVRCVKDTP